MSSDSEDNMIEFPQQFLKNSKITERRDQLVRMSVKARTKKQEMYNKFKSQLDWQRDKAINSERNTGSKFKNKDDDINLKDRVKDF